MKLIGNISKSFLVVQTHGSQIFYCQYPLKILWRQFPSQNFPNFEPLRNHKLEGTSGLLYYNNIAALQYIFQLLQNYFHFAKNVHERCFDRKEFKTSQTTKLDF